MGTALTPSERLTRLDREVGSLKDALVEVATQLADVPAESAERWRSVANRLRELRADLQPTDFDRDQIAQLYSTLFDIRDYLDGPRDLDTLDALVVAAERVRHVIRDALDEHVEGLCGEDVGLIVAELRRRLPNASGETLAQLVGVDRRTLSRWSHRAGRPSRRLKTVARLVAILRHNWTDEGIVAWFHRARRDLGGRTPLAVLGEKNFDEDALISAARAGRSMYAS